MVFNFFAILVDPMLSPLLTLQPHISLLIFAAVLTAIIFGINRLMINRKLAKEIKDKLTNIRENLTKAQKEGNKELINKFLSDYMQTNNQYLRQMFKVMIVSFIVIIIFFPWAANRFGGLNVASLPFALPFIGTNVNWIVWYILVSITVSWLLRKFIGE